VLKDIEKSLTKQSVMLLWTW